MGKAIYIAAALLAALAALAISLAPAPSAGDVTPTCVAKSERAIGLTQLIGDLSSRSCAQEQYFKPSDQFGYARFDIAQSSSESPKFLTSRIGIFEKLTVTVVDRDGSTRSRSYGVDEVRLISGQPCFLLDLPTITKGSQALILQIEGMQHDMTLTNAKIHNDDPSRTLGHYKMMLFLSLLMGLMLAPVLFDGAAWVALRSPFILWHASLAVAFSALVFVRSGLLVEFIDLSLVQMRALLIMSLSFAALAACMFTYSFVERGCLDKRMRKLLPIIGLWGVIASAIHATNFEFLKPLGGAFHSISMAPVLIVMVAAMIDAFRKGSRSIRFQAIGWIPLLFAFSLQFVSYVTPIAQPTDALTLFYWGIVSETVITALGVADRFFTLRHERDAALSHAQALGLLTERDPLTGLLNRRAIDARFSKLHAEGYEAFALIDLDHFKRVNDSAGHSKGDKVLQVVARLLSEEEGCIAIRMGGEEFLLLLSGEDAEERLARLHAAIPSEVSKAIPALEFPVTASIGLILAPRHALPKAVFEHLYNLADRLLYDAKTQGRNCIACEKLRGFDRRTGDRRQSKARVAAA